MHCYAFNLRLGSSIIQNPPICPSADTRTVSWATQALCYVVGVKQEDLHEITILRLPDLFLGSKNVSMGQFTIYYMLTDRVYVAIPLLCTLETACPSFPQNTCDTT